MIAGASSAGALVSAGHRRRWCCECGIRATFVVARACAVLTGRTAHIPRRIRRGGRRERFVELFASVTPQRRQRGTVSAARTKAAVSVTVTTKAVPAATKAVATKAVITTGAHHRAGRFVL